MPLSKARKAEYIERLMGLFESYDRLLMVNVDNVGSKQMATIRRATRGNCEIIMGKNTMMRLVLKKFIEKNPGHPFEQLNPLIKGNVGFVFTKADLVETRDTLVSNVVPAPAKAGALAPVDVFVPKGPTGCGPDETKFFQALNIPTKISRGQVDIINDMKVVFKGEKVTSGAAAVLQKLGIMPFSYGLVVTHVYDSGSIFSVSILDITDEVLGSKILQAASTIAAISMEIGYPTLAALPHMISNAFQKIASIALEVGYEFPALSAALAAGAASASSGGGGGGGAEEAAPAEEEEKEEEIDMGGGAGLFGDDDDDDY